MAAGRDDAPRPTRDAVLTHEAFIRQVGSRIVNTGDQARTPRLSYRLRRLAARHPVGTLLILVVPIAVVTLTPFTSVLSTHAAGVGKVAGIVVLMLSPVLLIATPLMATRVVRAVWHRHLDRRGDSGPQPDGPPIEKLAADLRRLLWNHDRVTRSADVAMCAGRLRALESAIIICATQAARSLDVPYPDPPTLGEHVPKPQLRLLLRALAAEGLVLPPSVALLAGGGRH
jgi:hypothetical protein